MQYIVENITSGDPRITETFPSSSEEYSEILSFYGTQYTHADPYLQVGEINITQGWILHISVVISQLASLLEKLIPVLLEQKVPFKIPTCKDTARNILNGNLDISRLGKVVNIYPGNPDYACLLAKKLIDLTKPFSGPDIPTDIHLGSCVYSRFGSFNPVVLEESNGKKSNYIYNATGNLIKDPYAIPFQMPAGVAWPFNELSSQRFPSVKGY